MKNVLHQVKTKEQLLDGMCYILQCDDGSTIVIDGGMAYDGAVLLEHLKKIFGEEKPVIDLWILTHAHPDHTFACMEIGNQYSNEVTVKKLLYRFPSLEFKRKRDPNTEFECRALEEAIQNFQGVQILAPHTGEIYQFGSVKLEILFTYEDLPSLEEEPTLNTNDTSTVFRVTVGGQSILFLGDIGKAANEVLLRRYGKQLKSDVCQVAHHGYFSSTAKFYDVVDPAILLWPASVALFRSVCTLVWPSRHLLEELHVQDVYLAGEGTVSLELPIALRENPRIPPIPPRCREKVAEYSFPKALRGFSWQDPNSDAWALSKAIEGSYFYSNRETGECQIRGLWSEEALYLKVQLDQALYPSTPQKVGTGDSNNIRIFVTEEVVTDFFCEWKDCPKEGFVSYLKFYPDEKNWKGRSTQCTMEGFESFLFCKKENGYTFCLAFPWEKSHQAGDLIGVNVEVSIANKEGTGRVCIYMLNKDKRTTYSYSTPSALPIIQLI